MKVYRRVSDGRPSRRLHQCETDAALLSWLNSGGGGLIPAPSFRPPPLFFAFTINLFPSRKRRIFFSFFKKCPKEPIYGSHIHASPSTGVAFLPLLFQSKPAAPCRSTAPGQWGASGVVVVMVRAELFFFFFLLNRRRKSRCTFAQAVTLQSHLIPANSHLPTRSVNEGHGSASSLTALLTDQETRSGLGLGGGVRGGGVNCRSSDSPSVASPPSSDTRLSSHYLPLLTMSPGVMVGWGSQWGPRNAS